MQLVTNHNKDEKMSKYFICLEVLSILVLFCACKNYSENMSYYDLDRKQIQHRRQGYFKKSSSGIDEFILNGKCQTWYPSGTLQSEMYFIDGTQCGDAMLWWPSGILRSKNHFNKKGLADGEQFVYELNGKLLKKYTMHNGTGIEYIFHDNGKPKYEISWTNGKMDGITKIFDQNGNLIAEEEYSNGVKLQRK